MKNYYPNYNSRKFLKYKGNHSLIMKFLGIDKRTRRNLVVGASLLVVVIFTGALLAIISLVQFGGNLIDEALGNLDINVERTIPHTDARNNEWNSDGHQQIQKDEIRGTDIRN
jgi:predicted PurR-regulated permease PerM